jgi:hypothetical protein
VAAASGVPGTPRHLFWHAIFMSRANNLQSNFINDLLAANRPGMDGFKEWLLQPGMLFGATGKWWGDHGLRYMRHEGLDLSVFAAVDGMIKKLDQHTRIPAAFAGEVIKIAPDFLGKSIYIRHAIFSAGGRQLISAYGHTVPAESLTAGQKVAAGEIIGRISGFPGKKTSLVPHLHLTFAWVPLDRAMEQLDWQSLGNDPGITLIDPLAVLSPPAEDGLVFAP